MSRRDLLKEIVDRRTRNASDASRFNSFATRQESLDEALKQLFSDADPESTSLDLELSRYFPIALIACIEGYFRAAIANLIDYGSPFIDRVGKLRDVNIAVEAAAAIQTKRITLGEYTAHFLTFGNLEDINRALSSLLDIDFLERLVTSEFHLYEDEPPIQLDESRGDFIVAVKELFHTRHVLCHEFATDIRIDNALLLRAFAATDVLVSLSEMIISSELESPDG